MMVDDDGAVQCVVPTLMRGSEGGQGARRWSGGGDGTGRCQMVIDRSEVAATCARKKLKGRRRGEGPGHICPHLICTGHNWPSINNLIYTGWPYARYKCSNLYRASSCPSTNVLFVSCHNEKHICTGSRGGPIQMCFSLFSLLIYFKYPKFLVFYYKLYTTQKSRKILVFLLFI
jgi:hypothetical protein